jgi:hypothetical protein
MQSIKLVRSANDGELFDLVPEVASRYGHLRYGPKVEIWKPNRQIPAIDPGTTLRMHQSGSYYTGLEMSGKVSLTPPLLQRRSISTV